MAKRKRSSAGATEALREVFTGGFIRSLAGIQDEGSAALVRVANVDDPGAHVDQSDRDVWVHVVDELAETPLVGRLHIPAGIVYALPAAGDSAMLLRARGAQGPGQPYVLHGDGGNPDEFPPWLDDGNCGVYTKRTVHVQSAQGSVILEVNPDFGKVLIGAGATKALGLDGDGSAIAPAWLTWLQGLATAASYATPAPTTALCTLTATALKGRGE